MKSSLAFDPGLMLVTDKLLSGKRSVAEVVEATVKGGATVVQLREKDAPIREFIDLGRCVLDILRPRRIPVLIDDRVDVALAVCADGVHLGQSDMAPADARRLLGRKAIIGLTVETIAQASAAERLEVNYLGVSPIFSTPTKTDTGPAWGIEGLRKLRSLVSKRLVAIGGINETNAARALEAGADGIAVVSAICAASNPGEAARRLREIVDRHRRAREGVRP